MDRKRIKRLALLLALVLTALLTTACPPQYYDNPNTWLGEVTFQARIDAHRAWQSYVELQPDDLVHIQVSGGKWSLEPPTEAASAGAERSYVGANGLAGAYHPGALMMEAPPSTAWPSRPKDRGWPMRGEIS